MIPRHPLTWPEGWKRTLAAARRPGQFSSNRSKLSIYDGYNRVLMELSRLGISKEDVVISTNVPTRLDGMPRSDKGEPGDSGVAVYWETAKGAQRVIAVDHYTRVADNLGAVAATLDALRAIERHGGAAILDRAFTGFDALPPPRSPWETLGCSAEHATEESIQAAYKSRVRSAHPDAGGPQNALSELNVARDRALAIVRARNTQ